MNKKKYLHRKGKFSKKWMHKHNYNKHPHGDELPFRESIRDNHKKDSNYYWNWSDGIDFTPAGNYIEEHINCCWDDIYSKLLKKVKAKNRWQLDDYLSWYLNRVVIVDYIPYIPTWGKRERLAVDCFFVDEDGILRKYKSEEEIRSMAKSKQRKEKLLKLIEIAKQKEDEETTI